MLMKLQNTQLLRSITAGLVATLLLGVLMACSPKTPEEQRVAYNKKLGSQGELTATHLILNWPARPGNFAPRTLKIPRKYLDNPPLARDDDGSIRWVYLRFPTMEAGNIKPAPQTATPENHAERLAASESLLRSRMVVTFDRDRRGGVGGASRDYVRESHNDGRHHMRDGMVADLERYTRVNCIYANNPPDPFTEEKVKNKPADDNSPPDCWLNRNSTNLVSPPKVKADNEGIDMSCSLVNCSVNFSAGHGVVVQSAVLYSDVPRWREFVEPVRTLIDSFVVREPVGATSDRRPAPTQPNSSK